MTTKTIGLSISGQISIDDETNSVVVELAGTYEAAQPSPPDPQPEPEPNPEGSAQWISPSLLEASSLDTGRIGYLCAWGGSEFGYAFTYALEDAPAGVMIDQDTGEVMLQRQIEPGLYQLNVVARNRIATELAAELPVMLEVYEGVTANRSGDQVLHQTYDPHSGTYGQPTGDDWTQVFLKLADAVKTEQAKHPDGKLRVTIPLQAGLSYDYTNNHWLTGLQDYTLCCAVADPVDRPQLRNTKGSDYEGGPLNIGKPGSFDHQNQIKENSAKIRSAGPGDDSVTLENAADASRIKVGRWHVVMAGCQQLGGYPPNVAVFDYVKPVSVDGSTISLDRLLRFPYSETFWEDPGDAHCFGRSWIIPWDTGGAGGLIPADPRLTLRGAFRDVDFLPNPNGSDISLVQAHIDMSFERCSLPNVQPTMSKHVLFRSSEITSGSEPDKVIETLIFDDCKTFIIGGATGAEYFLTRNSDHGCVQISPRQFRSIGSTFDGSRDTNLSRPFTLSYNGTLIEYHFSKTKFKKGSDAAWTWNNPPYSPVTIGDKGVRWDGDKLVIPRGFPEFGTWLNAVHPSMILTKTGVPPVPQNDYGYVTEVSSSGDGRELWLMVTWTGAKPTSGPIYPNGRLKSLRMDDDCEFLNGAVYSDASFQEQFIPASLGKSNELPPNLPAA